MKKSSGLFIGGGMMIGMGLGFLFNDMKAFMFLGIGAGLVAAAVISIMKKNSNE